MTTTLRDDVRLAVYRSFLDRERAPVAAEVADALGVAQADVEDTFFELAEDRVLVLAPGTPYIWMANPFSALPTPYVVEVGKRTWFGNCIWDALGILAMGNQDGRVRTRCADCGAAMTVEAIDGEVGNAPGAVHYAVPARQWWDDIGFN